MQIDMPRCALFTQLIDTSNQGFEGGATLKDEVLFSRRPPHDFVAEPDSRTLCRTFSDSHDGLRAAGALLPSAATGCVVQDSRRGAIYTHLAVHHPFKLMRQVVSR